MVRAITDLQEKLNQLCTVAQQSVEEETLIRSTCLSILLELCQLLQPYLKLLQRPIYVTISYRNGMQSALILSRPSTKYERFEVLAINKDGRWGFWFNQNGTTVWLNRDDRGF